MDTCTWDNPGADPYRTYGTQHMKAAVARYQFPEHVQHDLLDKIRLQQNDAVVYITKSGIRAPYGTAANLRDMHFGKDKMCVGEVKRTKWKDDHEEPALVYCSYNYCVAIPVVCENISRIDYIPRLRYNEHYAAGKVNTVPEPSTLYLLIVALLILKYGQTIYCRAR